MTATPLPAEVAKLLQLCRAEDRVGSGAVPRLVVERIMRAHCRGAMRAMGAATILDLLEAHTHGKTGNFVRYIGLTQVLQGVVRGS